MKKIVNSLIFIFFSFQIGSCKNLVLHDLEAANSQKIENIINIIEERDPFEGQYKGQLFGIDCTLIIINFLLINMQFM